MVASARNVPDVPPGYVANDEVNLLVFKGKSDLLPVLTAMKLSTDGEGVIHREDGSVASCDGCELTITVENLGHILPGSQYFYCTDPACVVKYFTEHL